MQSVKRFHQIFAPPTGPGSQLELLQSKNLGYVLINASALPDARSRVKSERRRGVLRASGKAVWKRTYGTRGITRNHMYGKATGIELRQPRNVA
jgi:hypothetical protein